MKKILMLGALAVLITVSWTAVASANAVVVQASPTYGPATAAYTEIRHRYYGPRYYHRHHYRPYVDRHYYPRYYYYPYYHGGYYRYNYVYPYYRGAPYDGPYYRFYFRSY